MSEKNINNHSLCFQNDCHFPGRRWAEYRGVRFNRYKTALFAIFLAVRREWSYYNFSVFICLFLGFLDDALLLSVFIYNIFSFQIEGLLWKLHNRKGFLSHAFILKWKFILWVFIEICTNYRIYSNNCRGAHLIFRAGNAALIRGRRLFKHCTR